ncbi:PREDICTED: C3 and PZP-like alpha-2-macroglobulin domain-containing protein 8 isoform X2 [Trachymyrmex septentrionalis]|uniref:C3 and PZP-like alpha-2-macroglobulin domain-containing protein 8 isoform X2 n=1 Tax=Trachymyrmex septentrionalis TaxID=34720 RepID=UPI00084F22E0|nr:PREDICTED: C3 and PZP-like alpha-2-macroglobulin domain-containing protein 8 isoform X2 [Trachymyrmex septentrionalis]
MAVSLNTEDKLEYHFYPVTAGQIQFRIKAPNDAHVALTTASQEGDPMYEVFIGGWNNSKSVVRKNRAKPEVAETETPGILSADEYRGFWIRWGNGVLTVGKEGESDPFLSYADPEPFGIGYFGVCTGWGATGEWLIEAICCGGDYGGHPSTTPSAPAEVRGLDAGSVCWCDAAGGMVPPDAVEGGHDEEPLFVGRAHHEGALIPGKVKPGHSVCYVAWGGAEHGKTDYQVLCGCKPTWVPVNGGNIPPNAIPGGETEDGEPLFVGRVHHEGTVTIGKVQPSHNVCYIPYAGSEIASSEYEVMVGQ